jgi:uncharacterized protein YheU (UPF0270 family)
MAGLLSSRVFDRLSIETAKLKVSDNAIKTGALNEIKTQITDWKMRQEKDKSGTIIPYEKLSMEALEGLIEEFVTRDGTDTGYEKKSLVNDVAMVKRQLKRGDAVIVYDKSTKTSNIVSRDHLKKL